ncbi:BRO family protein [Bacillus cereus group sp. N21]|uniref:BRO-N domain-containing protein n=1 Tax=Bacillus cereus group sp. N21 TaxID=2794591 RepID=UPI0018F28E08|nr:hypothetical protein [Bacillus cereus group sp. N21]
MTNNLQVFDGALGQVRTVLQGEDILFIAKDVCDVLEIVNTTRALSRLDEDELHSMKVTDSLGRHQDTNAVNESGLYSLIMTSRKPQAKAFKKWITSEVIPSIRRDGGYIATNEQDDEQTILAKAFLLANKTIERQKEAITRLEALTSG